MSGAVTRAHVERWTAIEAAASVWVEATDKKIAAMAAGDSEAFLHAEILRERAEKALRAALRGVR